MENLFFSKHDLKCCGENVIIGKTVRIRNPHLVSIGDGVIIDDFTYLSCATSIGRHTHIASGVTISGGGGSVEIGDYVGISTGVNIFGQSSDYINASFDLPSIPEEWRVGSISSPVTIGNHVLLGAQTIVMPGVSLPTGLAAAARTTLRSKKYDAWSLYYGDDAKLLMKRKTKRLEQHLSSLEIENAGL